MIFDRIGSLFRHAAVYGAGDILGRAISLILVSVYARMLSTEANGVRVDPDELDRQRQRLNGRIDELRLSVMDQTRCDFNLDSPK